MEDTENKSEFKVRDKRRFTAEGETSAAEHPEEKSTQVSSEEESKPEPPPEQPSRTEKEETYRPIDFNSLVLSLANTVLFQLGLVKAGDTEPTKDLLGARQTIDLLALIQEKTRGNLTEQEQKILEETLFQLRMAYVEAAK